MRDLVNVIKIGRVSSVDIENRKARVVFPETGIVSAPLKIMLNSPLITVSKDENGEKWENKSEYCSADRGLGIGEKYIESPPDIIENKKTVGEKTYTEKIEVHGWLPYVGQLVLCLFLANGDGDGFILGGV